MKIHDVQLIDFAGTKMILKVDGQEYSVDLPSISPSLANAQDAARRHYSVSPSGYGIHWPDLDEDLTVAGLIAAARRSQAQNREAPLAFKEQQSQ